ncbi:MAG: ABC transporter ATP-binding protein [Planctomycetes bacterium]|nr:ABC transporter ATP-binding protein [Planctomycetota bacterium]
MSSDPSSGPAVRAEGLSFRYGQRQALDGIGFLVERGAAHGFLGPNGSGKSTLFKLLSTLVPMQQGSVSMLGFDLGREAKALRHRLGVVFQSPAVDQKLTVRENLRYGGLMIGLSGNELGARIDAMLEAARLGDRERDRVGELSGGLRRRVEIAKCLLGRPEIVLLDEASTGLDPAARQDMWAVLRAQSEVTVLFTTHLMDEAAEADHLTLLDEGRIVATGRPAELVREVGDQVLEIESVDVESLRAQVRDEFGRDGDVVDGTLRIEGTGMHELIPAVMQRHGERVQRLQLSHPSLQDVFLRKTGKRFVVDEPELSGAAAGAAKGRRRRR